MKPSIVFKDRPVQVVCEPAYMATGNKLAPLTSTDLSLFKVYTAGMAVDYMLLESKHAGLVSCINQFNQAHK